jgi:hypothetical protein
MTSIIISWLTSPVEAKKRACWTVGQKSGGKLSVATWRRFLLSEHSIIRSAILTIELRDINQFASVHFARHKHADHYVRSNRPDWTGKERTLADTKDHLIDINCQGLIDMARKRLCFRASDKTREIMLAIKKSLSEGDNYMQVLGRLLEPNCLYRGGYCFESDKSCGLCPIFL